MPVTTSNAGAPVFVDPSGRRRRLVRRLGMTVVALLLGYAALLVVLTVNGVHVSAPGLPLLEKPLHVSAPATQHQGAHVDGDSDRFTSGPATAPASTTPPSGSASVGGASHVPSAPPGAVPTRHASSGPARTPSAAATPAGPTSSAPVPATPTRTAQPTPSAAATPAHGNSTSAPGATKRPTPSSRPTSTGAGTIHNPHATATP